MGKKQRSQNALALQALGMIAETAVELKRIDWDERRDNLDREFRREEREDQQAFTKDLERDRREFELASQYKGVTFNDDGTPNYENVDWSNTLQSEVFINQSTTEDLREAGLSYEGTDQERETRLGVYNKAKSLGLSMMQSSISPTISMQIGDRSRGFFTEHDITDYEEWYLGSGGATSPIALNDLVETGIISPDRLQIDSDTGLYTADDTAKELIDVAFQGMKIGARANQSYKTAQAYEEMEDAKRLRNLQFAESVTNHPKVVMATKIYGSTARALGSSVIAGQFTEQGEMTVQWKGEQAKFEDVIELFDGAEGVYKDQNEKSAFKAFMSQLLHVTADGSGLENVLIQSAQNPRLLKILSQFDQALAKSVYNAQFQFNKIQKISDIAGDFITSPVDPAQISDFRAYLQESGLMYGFQNLRTMQASGDPKAAEYKEELMALASQEHTKIRNSGDKKMVNDFLRWLELEEATSGLFIDNLRKAGNR